jgi:hypothetical protein
VTTSSRPQRLLGYLVLVGPCHLGCLAHALLGEPGERLVGRFLLAQILLQEIRRFPLPEQVGVAHQGGIDHGVLPIFLHDLLAFLDETLHADAALAAGRLAAG